MLRNGFAVWEHNSKECVRRERFQDRLDIKEEVVKGEHRHNNINALALDTGYY